MKKMKKLITLLLSLTMIFALRRMNLSLFASTHVTPTRTT